MLLSEIVCKSVQDLLLLLNPATTYTTVLGLSLFAIIRNPIVWTGFETMC